MCCCAGTKALWSKLQHHPSLVEGVDSGFVEVKGRGHRDDVILTYCSSCNQKTDMTGGIYDDGEWMCGGCIAGYIEAAENDL